MAKTATITDTFDTSLNAATWGDTGTATVFWAADGTGGHVELVVDTTSALRSFYRQAADDFTGSSVYAKIVFPASPNGQLQNALEVSDDKTVGTNRIRWYRNGATALSAILVTGGTTVSQLDLTYSATDHAWLRLREAAGTIYWDSSPDGLTWTNRHSATAPTWGTNLTVVYPRVRATRAGTEATATVQVDNYNTTPARTAPAAVAAVGAVPTATAAVTATPGVVAASAGIPGPAVSVGTTPVPATVAAAAAVPAPPAPLIETLVDDFSGALGPQWVDVADAATGGGLLTVTCLGSYGHAATGTAYKLAGSRVAVQVPTLPAIGNGTTQGILQVVCHNVFGDRVETIAEVAAGVRVLVFRHAIGGVLTDTQVTYSATDHAWWRIREAAGTIYWDTSPDGIGWTNQRAQASALDTGLVSLSLVSGYYGAETAPGTTEFDNLNILPVATPGVVAAGAAVPAVSVQTGSAAGPSAAAVLAPTPTAAVAAGASAGPASVAVVAGVPAAQAQAGIAPSPGAVAAAAAIPGPALATGSTLAAVAIAGLAAVPGPAVATSSAVSPTTVAAVSAVPGPMFGNTPLAVAVTAAVPGPVVLAGATLPASTVAAVVAVPVPGLAAGVATSPGLVSAAAGIPSVTVHADAEATPLAVAAVVAVPSPSLAGASTATPAAVPAVAGAPAPAVQVGSTLTASATATTAAVPAPAVAAGAGATPGLLVGVALLPAVAVSTGAAPSPSMVGAVAQAFAPTVSTDGAAGAQAVTTVAAVPQASLSTSGTAGPAPVGSVAAMSAPVVSAGATPTPDVLMAVAAVAALSVRTGATAGADLVTLSATVGAVLIAAGSVAAGIPAAAVTLVPDAAAQGGASTSPGTVIGHADLPPAEAWAQSDSIISVSPTSATAAVPIAAVSVGSTLAVVSIAAVAATPPAVAIHGVGAAPDTVQAAGAVLAVSITVINRRGRLVGSARPVVTLTGTAS